MANSAAYDVNTESPVILIFGSAPALRQRVVEQVLDACLDEDDRQWGLVRIDGSEADPEQIQSHFTSGSLMAASRVVLLRDVHELSNAQQKELAKALGDVPPGVRVILEADERGRGRNTKPDVAADLRKAVQQAGQVVEASPPSEYQLPGWVQQEVRAAGKNIAKDAAQALVETTGGDAGVILTEIQKLVTYAGDSDSITAGDVEKVATGQSESSIFNLVDAIGQRDARTALSILPDLLPAGSPAGAAMPILGMIARQLRLVWQARILMDAGVNLGSPGNAREQWEPKLPDRHGFFQNTSGRGFLVKKYSAQTHNFNSVQMVRAFVKIHETDMALKGQTKQRLDDRLALERLIVSLCRL